MYKTKDLIGGILREEWESSKNSLRTGLLIPVATFIIIAGVFLILFFMLSPSMILYYLIGGLALDERTLTPLISLSQSLHDQIFSNFGSLCVTGYLLLLSLLIGIRLYYLFFRILIDSIILPRQQWVMLYFSLTANATKATSRFLFVVGTMFFVVLTVYLVSHGFSSFDLHEAVSFTVLIVLTIATVSLVWSYWYKKKHGLIAFVAANKQTMLEGIRFLVADTLHYVSIFWFFFIALVVLQYFTTQIIPTTITDMNKSIATEFARFEQLHESHSIETRDTLRDRIEKVQTNLVRTSIEFPTEFTGVFDNFKETIGFIVALTFVTGVLFPLFHFEIERAWLAASLNLLVLLVLDQTFGDLMPKLFHLGDKGISPLFIAGTIIIVSGEVTSAAVRSLFQKEKSCSQCRRSVAGEARFCSYCGTLLVSVQSSTPEYIGDQGSMLLHQTTCPIIYRRQSKRQVRFSSVEQALSIGFHKCDLCFQKTPQQIHK